MAAPLRICAVSFLNAWPLYQPLISHPPKGEDGQPLFSVEEALPAECARRLAAGECDIALLPVASYLDHPEWEVVPEIAIAARGAVQTVVVVSEVPLSEVTTIHLDAASRSSVLLLRTLLATEGLTPTLVTAPHGQGAGLVQGTEAALVIGDAAFDLADRFTYTIDLGSRWHALTGLPMVFAFWAARPGVLREEHVAALHAARDRGLAFAENLAGRYRRQRLDAGQTAQDDNFYANYLRRTIRYRLDGWERQGLVEYIARSHEHGLHEADQIHVRFAAREHEELVAARHESPRVGHAALDVADLLGRAAAGERLRLAEGIVLYEQADTLALGDAADARRRDLHPEGIVTYIIDRNVNYTNVCTARCKFCNFYVPPTRKDEGYVHSKEVLAAKFAETERLGGVQILLQGGLHPELGLSYYEDLFRWTKANFRLKLHALSPTEIIHIAHLEDMSIREVLERLRAAGLDSLPGGGAEMLHDEIRNRISPFKNTTDEWLEVMRQAHIIGLKSTCTMVFGFQETAEHTLVHLERLRRVQDEALARDNGGMFTAFIVWPFQAAGTSLHLRDDTSAWRYLRLQALARLFLDNIPNIQVSWPTLGPEIGEIALRFGANDFGSVMIEENVVSKAGAHFMLSAEQIEHHVRQAGFVPRRRNMQYDLLPGAA